MNNESELIRIINTFFPDVVIKNSSYKGIDVFVNKNSVVSFYFETFGNENVGCERFKNHTCISLNYTHKNPYQGGGGYMEVADTNPAIEDEVIDFISQHLGIKKCAYQQMFLF